jgi:hypothetical protein
LPPQEMTSAVAVADMIIRDKDRQSGFNIRISYSSRRSDIAAELLDGWLTALTFPCGVGSVF